MEINSEQVFSTHPLTEEIQGLAQDYVIDLDKPHAHSGVREAKFQNATSCKSAWSFPHSVVMVI